MSKIELPPNPIDKLTAEQKGLLEKAKAEVATWTLNDDQKAFLTDITIWRYMWGYQFDMEMAMKTLKKCVDWRASFQPTKLRLTDVEKAAKSGYLFTYGHDKNGRPVIYLTLRKNVLENTEEVKKLIFKHFVYIQERCAAKMPQGVYNITWVCDLNGASLSIGLIQTFKGVFDELGEYYAERMCRIILMNYGWGINFIWSFLKPFLYQHTLEKWIFLATSGTSKTEIAKGLSQYIDLDQVPEEIYGNNKFKFEWEAELQREKTDYQ